MKLTQKQLRQIIKEEFDDHMSDSLSSLLNHEDPEYVMQGIELASSMGMPIVISKKPKYKLLNFIKSMSDPEILKSLSGPMNHDIVQAKVANNQNTPIGVIKQMAFSDEHAIRAVNYARKNLNLYCQTHPEDNICGDMQAAMNYKQ
jgi:hypothetical protein